MMAATFRVWIDFFIGMEKKNNLEKKIRFEAFKMAEIASEITYWLNLSTIV